MGNISKITTKFSVLCLDHVSSTQWIHIVEWIEPFAKGSQTGAFMKQELKQFDHGGDKSSLTILAKMKEIA